MKTKVVVVARKTVLALAAVVATLLLMLPPGGGVSAPAAATTATGRSNCTSRCGNISIPYPFGIETGCYHAAGFNLTCKNSSHHHQPPKLFLGDGLQVLDISIPNATVRISVSAKVIKFHDIDGTLMVNRTWGVALTQSGPYPYFLSDSDNMIQLIGFEKLQPPYELASYNYNTSMPYIVLNATSMPYIFDNGNNEYHEIVMGYSMYNIDVGYSFYNIRIHRVIATIRDDGSVDTVDRDAYMDYGSVHEKVWVTLGWVIANHSCPTTANVSAPECRSIHSSCQESSPFFTSATDDFVGYTCQCSDGYQGNPYVPDDGPDACQGKLVVLYVYDID
jgi:hypothetical protein